ncbi:hypothetical protein AVEN_161408-1 [Araneus ventricosus]|uniref:Uncharacterized protein n=1 Tax=Araneus ventricosus TaxID=182803 RepID=A0A4Y2R9Z5_ARAVE|nr:hypothetical protein AVEN_161408-1 [Araneus ventricosus]
MIERATGPMHGGSSVESGFEPGTLWPRSRDLTTWPPRSRPSRDCSISMIIILSQNPPAFYFPTHSGFSPNSVFPRSRTM